MCAAQQWPHELRKDELQLYYAHVVGLRAHKHPTAHLNPPILVITRLHNSSIVSFEWAGYKAKPKRASLLATEFTACLLLFFCLHRVLVTTHMYK